MFLILIFTETHSGKINLLTCYVFLLPNENSFVVSHGGRVGVEIDKLLDFNLVFVE